MKFLQVVSAITVVHLQIYDMGEFRVLYKSFNVKYLKVYTIL